MKLSKTSLVLLVFQLLLVSSIAGKYLYQRWHCPRVWTRAVMYDPSLLMRGRYLSVQLTVDGCRSTLPSAKEAAFPRNIDGVAGGPGFSVTAPVPVRFPATITVEGNKLTAIRIQNPATPSDGVAVEAQPGASCEQMRLATPVNFYIAEHAVTPLPVQPGQELWIEVTVPSSGPPRPLQLALKQNSTWKPLAFQ
jgi:hypothetical protein